MISVFDYLSFLGSCLLQNVIKTFSTWQIRDHWSTALLRARKEGKCWFGNKLQYLILVSLDKDIGHTLGGNNICFHAKFSSESETELPWTNAEGGKEKKITFFSPHGAPLLLWCVGAEGALDDVYISFGGSAIVFKYLCLGDAVECYR